MPASSEATSPLVTTKIMSPTQQAASAPASAAPKSPQLPTMWYQYSRPPTLSAPPSMPIYPCVPEPVATDTEPRRPPSSSLRSSSEKSRVHQLHEEIMALERENRRNESLIVKTNQKFAHVRVQFRKSFFPDELRFVLLKNFYEDCLEKRQSLQENKSLLLDEYDKLTAVGTGKDSQSSSNNVHASTISKSREILNILDHGVTGFFRKIVKKKQHLMMLSSRKSSKDSHLSDDVDHQEEEGDIFREKRSGDVFLSESIIPDANIV